MISKFRKLRFSRKKTGSTETTEATQAFLQKLRCFTLPLGLLFCLLITWELLVRGFNLSESVFPAPSALIADAAQLFRQPSIYKHILVSLFRVTLGFGLAVFLGVPFGLFVSQFPSVICMVLPIVNFLRPISPIAWLPLAVLWFGIGEKSPIFLIFLAGFLPLTILVVEATRKVPKDFFYTAMTKNLSQVQKVWHILLPAVFPDLIAAFRIILGISWVVLVAAEMLSVNGGLGYFILDSRNAARIDHVVVGMLLLGFFGKLSDEPLRMLRASRYVAWSQSRLSD